jgi:hypothetical protein
MIGVQRHQHIVPLRQPMRGFGQNNGAKGRLLDRQAGGKFTAAGRNLDDPIRFLVGKRLERPVDVTLIAG